MSLVFALNNTAIKAAMVKKYLDVLKLYPDQNKVKSALELFNSEKSFLLKLDQIISDQSGQIRIVNNTAFINNLAIWRESQNPDRDNANLFFNKYVLKNTRTQASLMKFNKDRTLSLS